LGTAIVENWNYPIPEWEEENKEEREFDDREGDWIFLELSQMHFSDEEIGKFVVASEYDCTRWTRYAHSLTQQALYLFVFYTFRKRVRVVEISEINKATLKWLTDLYSGKAAQDNQINVLPFTIKNPAAKNLDLLFWHLQILTLTIGHCAGLIHAGYVHLMSREESAVHVTSSGDYLLRVSNLKPNQLVLTYWDDATEKIAHKYLEGTVIASLDLDKTVEKINGKKYLVYRWENELLMQWLNENASELCLEKCVLGQITLHDMKESNYDMIIRSHYATFELSEESIYVSAARRLHTM